MNKKMAVLSLCAAVLLSLAGGAARTQSLTYDQYKHYDVPFVPTPQPVVEAMLKLAAVRPGEVMYDLGCGDGRIVLTAAKIGAKATGIDIDPLRIADCEKNMRESGMTGKVRFIQGDLFQADFKDADVITMYLLTSVNRRLRPKLLSDLRPGARLVSHSFDMGDWSPDKKVTVPLGTSDDRYIYYWVVPANMTGHWEWTLPAGDNGAPARFALTADQKFQELSGKVTVGGKDVLLQEPKLEGGKVHFKADVEAKGTTTTWVFDGEVAGHQVTGTARPDSGSARPVAWKAVRDPASARPLDTAAPETRY